MRDLRPFFRMIARKLLTLPLIVRQGIVVVGAAVLVIVVIVLVRAHTMPHELTLTSTAFADGQAIPVKYTCDGENINPPFSISHVPAETQSFVLTIEDKTQNGHPAHWIAWNIPAKTETIQEGIRPAGTVARSFAGNFGYSGPCPDPGIKHTYTTHLYALKTAHLSLNSGASLSDLQKAIKSEILDETTLNGTYQREKK